MINQRVAPVSYLGVQSGFGHGPDVLLYNLLAPLGDHPAGSTVSAQTLMRHGFAVPIIPRLGRSGAAHKEAA